jgi:hypothetical protein
MISSAIFIGGRFASFDNIRGKLLDRSPCFSSFESDTIMCDEENPEFSAAAVKAV